MASRLHPEIRQAHGVRGRQYGGDVAFVVFEEHGFREAIAGNTAAAAVSMLVWL